MIYFKRCLLQAIYVCLIINIVNGCQKNPGYNSFENPTLDAFQEQLSKESSELFKALSSLGQSIQYKDFEGASEKMPQVVKEATDLKNVCDDAIEKLRLSDEQKQTLSNENTQLKSEVARLNQQEDQKTIIQNLNSTIEGLNSTIEELQTENYNAKQDLKKLITDLIKQYSANNKLKDIKNTFEFYTKKGGRNVYSSNQTSIGIKALLNDLIQKINEL